MNIKDKWQQLFEDALQSYLDLGHDPFMAEELAAEEAESQLSDWWGGYIDHREDR